MVHTSIHVLLVFHRGWCATVHDWFTCNRLIMNINKSCFSIYHTQNKQLPFDLNELHFNGFVIKRESTVKYIGLILDEKLQWNDHVN